MFAVLSTFCRIAVSEGLALKDDKELKKPSIAEPSAVELAEVDVEVRPKIFWTCSNADWSVLLCACCWVCCCTLCSRILSRWETGPAPVVTPSSKTPLMLTESCGLKSDGLAGVADGILICHVVCCDVQGNFIRLERAERHAEEGAQSTHLFSVSLPQTRRRRFRFERVASNVRLN